MNNLTELPEKWAILTCKEAGDWLDKNYTNTGGYSSGYANTTSKYLIYPSKGTSHIFDNIPHNYTEITLEQFKKWVLKDAVSEPVLESKIQAGKWYRCEDRTYFAKCLKFEEDVMTASELFMVDYQNCKSYDFCSGYIWVEATIEEIERFLPKGHPDKTTEKYVPIVGDWVRFTWTWGDGYEMVGKFVTIDSNFFETTSTYSISNDSEIGYSPILAHEIANIRKIAETEAMKLLPENMQTPIAVKSKKKFEVGWYTWPSFPQVLYYIKEDFSGWGFDSNGIWIEFQPRTSHLSELVSATDEKITKRLLEYANKQYPIGTKYIPLDRADTTPVKVNQKPVYGSTGLFAGFGYIYLRETGKWAEILTKEVITAIPKGLYTEDVIGPITKELDQDAICAHCKDRFFDGSVNTGPYNLCEGSKCAEAKESYEESTEEKKEFVGEVVHCTTQEEWNTVLSIFNPRSLRKDTWSKGVSDCLVLEHGYNIGCHGQLQYLINNNYLIISFENWCARNGINKNKRQYPEETIQKLENLSEKGYRSYAQENMDAKQSDLDPPKVMPIAFGKGITEKIEKGKKVELITEEAELLKPVKINVVISNQLLII